MGLDLGQRAHCTIQWYRVTWIVNGQENFAMGETSPSASKNP